MFVIGSFSFGVYCGRNWFPKEKIIEKQIQVKGDTKTETKVVYIEKKPGEKTDVELNIDKPGINVRLNGKEFTLVPDFDEQHKFENGKLVFNQESKFNVDIKQPEPKLGFGIGGLLTNESASVLISLPFGNKNEALLNVGTTFDKKTTYGLGYIHRF